MTPMLRQGSSGRERQCSSANCRNAGNVRSVVEKLTDLPDSWPLMRILIPLDGLSLQIERIIACVAAELSATHLEAKTLGKFVKRVAKKLTAMLACFLAGEVASTLSPVAAVGHREMVAPMYLFFLARCCLGQVPGGVQSAK